MNKTTLIVLQEIIRNKDFNVEKVAKALGKAKTTIYDDLAELRKNNILNKNNELKVNELTNAYKLLFLKYPYDFSFLTDSNLKIIFILKDEISFGQTIKKSNLSRFTTHQLLKSLKNRGFVNKKNKLIAPKELIELVKVIEKFQNNTIIELPANAAVINDNQERKLIQTPKNIEIPLKKTAFSAFNISIALPANYYSTKKKISTQDIFDDAKTISDSQREKLLTTLYYKKNRKKLKKDAEYEEVLKTEEFKEMNRQYD